MSDTTSIFSIGIIVIFIVLFFVALSLFFLGGTIALFLFLISLTGLLPFSWLNVGIGMLGFILLKSMVNFSGGSK